MIQNPALMSGLKLVDMGSFDDRISLPVGTGKTIAISERVPRGIKRLFIFGNIQQEGGTARNIQIQKRHTQKNKVYPISPNDTNVKSLEGNQVLYEYEQLEVVVGSEADNAEIVWSVSYLDYAR